MVPLQDETGEDLNEWTRCFLLVWLFGWLLGWVFHVQTVTDIDQVRQQESFFVIGWKQCLSQLPFFTAAFELQLYKTTQSSGHSDLTVNIPRFTFTTW